MKQIVILFLVILFTGCGNDNAQTKSKTGNPPDTIQDLIAFRFEGQLRYEIAGRLEIDTLDWIWEGEDSTTLKKKIARKKFWYIPIVLFDSVRDSITGRGIRPKLDTLGKPALKQLTLIAKESDSVVLISGNVDIRKIKKQYNLK